MVARPTSLLDYAASKGVVLPAHPKKVPNQADPLSGKAIEAHHAGRQADDLDFPLDWVVIDSDLDQVGFETVKHLDEATKVFARWGAALPDYLDSYEHLVCAWYGFVGRARGEMQRLAMPALAAIHATGVERKYLEAVKAGDKLLAAKLFPLTTYFPSIEEDTRLRLLQTKTEERRATGALRADARENAVVAYLSGLRLPGGTLETETFGSLCEQFFAYAREPDRQYPKGHGYTWSGSNMALRFRGDHHRKLMAIGLMPLTDYPVNREACLVFCREKLSEKMGRSRLKQEWRTFIGPFAGFDQNWRLLMPEDLAHLPLGSNETKQPWES